MLNLRDWKQATNGKRVLVVGDVMLDRYLYGKVERISPEAPVPVLNVLREEFRPGGAANVALNLKALQVEPVLVGVIGKDSFGADLKTSLYQSGIDPEFLLIDDSRPTTTKTRLIGNMQQILRLDRETTEPVSVEVEDKVLDLLKSIPPWDALIIEDYDKGLLSETLIQQLIQLSIRSDVPVLVDPKFNNFFSFSGCSWFKPNLKELLSGMATGSSANELSNEDLVSSVVQLRKVMPHQHTLLTLSEKGMLYIDPDNNYEHIPAHIREIRDVSGAGDSVISVVATALVVGCAPIEAAQLANLAGGLACEEVGVVPVSLETLLEEARTIQ